MWRLCRQFASTYQSQINYFSNFHVFLLLFLWMDFLQNSLSLRSWGELNKCWLIVVILNYFPFYAVMCDTFFLGQVPTPLTSSTSHAGTRKHIFTNDKLWEKERYALYRYKCVSVSNDIRSASSLISTSLHTQTSQKKAYSTRLIIGLSSYITSLLLVPHLLRIKPRVDIRRGSKLLFLVKREPFLWLRVFVSL